MCRRIAAELRNRFEIAHIARKSSGRWPSASRTLRSAGSRPSSRSCVARAASLAPQLARDVQHREHVVLGRAEVHEARPQPDTRPSISADARYTRPSAWMASARAWLCALRSVNPGGTWRNGTIDSCGAARHVSKSAAGLRPSDRAAPPRRGSARSPRGTARAPCARNASQSFSARNGREYSSVMSAACSSCCWCGRYPCSCAKAPASASASRTRTTPHAFGQVEPLVRVDRAPNRRARAPRTGPRCDRRPPAARTRRRRGARRRAPRRRRRSASIGSIAPVSVVPAVATTATGVTPAATSRSIASAGAPRAASGAASSIGMSRRLVDSDPQQLDRAGDRVVHLRGAVDRDPPTAAGPRAREPGSARSRAAASAVTLLMVPPLVNAPFAAGKPTNSPTHRTAWCSSIVAAPRIDRQVDVVGVRQQVGERADLEARSNR